MLSVLGGGGVSNNYGGRGRSGDGGDYTGDRVSDSYCGGDDGSDIDASRGGTVEMMVMGVLELLWL